MPNEIKNQDPGVKSADHRLRKVIGYYMHLGPLFEDITDHSGFMNLGYLEKENRSRSIPEAQKELVRKAAQTASFQTGMRVLDVGCGLGGPGKFIADEFQCRVVGIDPGHYQRDLFRRRPKTPSRAYGFEPLAADAMHLPFQPRCFDRIYSIESAFHYPDKSRFVMESAGILKSGGLLVVADILPKHSKGFSWLSSRFQTALESPQMYSLESYQKAADQAGLELIRFSDVSEGVRRVFPVWRNAFFKKWQANARRYSMATLVKIGGALIFASWFSKFIPFRYLIMVFAHRQPLTR